MHFGLKDFYSKPARRDFVFYVIVAAASAFFVAIGTIDALRYIGVGGFGYWALALVCVPIILFVVLMGRAEKFAIPGRLRVTISATILASVLVFYLIL